MSTIVGLCGAAGAGKGSVASRLARSHGFVSLSLADPLYEAVSLFTGVPISELQNRERKEADIPGLGMSPRRMLQTLGTEWGRQIVSPNIWIHHLFRRIGDFDVVVPDVRFLNEAEAIRRAGGVVWRIERDAKCLVGEAASHSSEHELDGFQADQVIVNEGSLSDLHARVDRLLAATMK
jgi:hypothetical protein